MKKNLVLTGMMGVGKSTIGKKLAQNLKLKFVDIDKVIDLYQRFNSDEHIPSLGQVINEMDKDYSKNCISGESPVKLPGNQIKTYDEQLKWWEGHVVASEHD